MSEHHCALGPFDRPFAERHEGFVIALVRSGVFCYATEGRTRVMGPGCVLLGSPGQEYVCSHEYGCGDVCTAFEYGPAAIGEISRSVGRDITRFPVAALAPQPRIDVLHRLIQEAVERPGSGPAIDELAWALGVRVVTATFDVRVAANGAAERRTDRDRVWAAVRHIEACLVEPLTLEDLARAAGLSPFHFLRLFRRETGLTPHQYLIRARLRRAVSLLRDTSIPITEVAYEVGFGDLSNFVRTFHRQVGCPPQAFRRGRLDRNFLQAEMCRTG